jgi:hypothetical protein
VRPPGDGEDGHARPAARPPPSGGHPRSGRGPGIQGCRKVAETQSGRSGQAGVAEDALVAARLGDTVSHHQQQGPGRHRPAGTRPRSRDRPARRRPCPAAGHGPAAAAAGAARRPAKPGARTRRPPPYTSSMVIEFSSPPRTHPCHVRPSAGGSCRTRGSAPATAAGPHDTGALIGGRSSGHPHAGVILSTPGIGPVPGAGFIARTGGGTGVLGSPAPPRLQGVVPTREGGEEDPPTGRHLPRPGNHRIQIRGTAGQSPVATATGPRRHRRTRLQVGAVETW